MMDGAGRTWKNVRDEKHRDRLVKKTNQHVFCTCYEKMFGGISWNLYYRDWYFEPSPVDERLMSELDEMLAHFIELKANRVSF